MKSEWRVTSNIFGGKKMYAIYRLKDINEVDHSGNREFFGPWLESREETFAIAAGLNEKEKKPPKRPQ